MWPDRRVLDLFGIELPIVQAPMANATAVDMAVAVANAGGLGSFPCAALTDDKIAEGVAAIRSRTNRPINLNFFCHKLGPQPDETAWHAALVPFWAERLGRNQFTALKASERTGLLDCRLDGDRVLLGGHCHTVIVGQFQL